jgi:D-alanine-D-alanine ligase
MDVPDEPPPQRVLVLFNTPAEVPLSGQAIDRVSEAGVVECARAVAKALESRGHAVELWGVSGALGPLVERLASQSLSSESLALRERASVPELVVFNLCEGLDGDSSKEALLPMLYEAAGVAYTGCGPEALMLAHSKTRTREILAARGIPVPPGVAVERAREIPWKKLPWPVIVKPAREDASLGIRADGVLTRLTDLAERVEALAASYRQQVLVERYLPGREFVCALVPLWTADGVRDLEALPLSEVDYSALPESLPKILSYEAKWDVESPIYQKTPTVCPADVDGRLAAELVHLARAACRALDVQSYARVDLRLDERGRAHVLDVNPNPDLSPDAGLARQARAAGMEYADLAERVLACAWTPATARRAGSSGDGVRVDAHDSAPLQAGQARTDECVNASLGKVIFFRRLGVRSGRRSR